MKHKIAFFINLLCLIISITTLWLYLAYEISLKGFYTEKVIIWIWMLSLAILWIQRKKLPGIQRIYLFLNLILIVLTMLPMMIPFMALTKLTFDDTSYQYLEERIRIQPSIGIAVAPQLEVVEEGLLTEKVVHTPEPFTDLDSVKLLQKKDSMLEVALFYHLDNSSVDGQIENRIRRVKIKR